MTLNNCSSVDPDKSSINDSSKRNSKYYFWKDANGETRWIEIDYDGDFEHQDGLMTEFHDNGKAKLSVEYKNGEQDGEILAWNTKGKLILKGELTDNRPCSNFSLFYQDGKPFVRLIIENCRAKTMKFVNKKGIMIAQLNFDQVLEGSYLSGDLLIANEKGMPRIIYKDGHRTNVGSNGKIIDNKKLDAIGYLYGDLSQTLFKCYLKKIRTSDQIVVKMGCLEGNCEDGFGVYGDVFGARFKGNFKNGVITGQGEVLDVFGKLVYSGQFKNGYLNGEGKYFGSNVTYEGQFENDLFSGKGKITFKNGDSYEGEFLNDLQNGNGIYTYASGEKEVGIWVDGVLVR